MVRIAFLLFCILFNMSLWAQSPRETFTHYVQAGESLQSLAQKHDITVDEIRALNPKIGDRIYAGTPLLLPRPATVVPSGHAQAEPEASASGSKQEQPKAKQEQPKAKQEKPKQEQPKQEQARVAVPTSPKLPPRQPKPLTRPASVSEASASGSSAAIPAASPSGSKRVSSLELHYVSREHANASTLRNSQGMALNGIRVQTILMSDEGLHIIDSTLHLHTLLLPRQRIAYLYSDVLRQGLRFDLDLYVNLHMSSLAPDDESIVQGYQVEATSQSIQDLGHVCTAYSGRVFVTTQATQVDLWATTDYVASPYLRYFTDGLRFEGIPTRFVIGRQSSHASRLGSRATHLVSIDERRIDKAELLPPSGIQMEAYSHFRQLDSFHASHLKALQKAGLYPADATIETPLRYTIGEAWDF